METISTKHMKIQLGDNVATWREGHKSKVARRHRGKLLQQEVFTGWAAAVEDAKSADGGDWVAKHQIKLKMRKMFRCGAAPGDSFWQRRSAAAKRRVQRLHACTRSSVAGCFLVDGDGALFDFNHIASP